MGKDNLQTNVRLPASLKEKLTIAAQAAGRSFTAELVSRLEDSFDSIEVLMLANRLEELGQLKAEVDRLVVFVDGSARSGGSGSDAHASALEQITRLRGHIDDVRYQINEISNAMDKVTTAAMEDAPRKRKAARITK